MELLSEGARSLTGLEGSALGGQGSGISPFVPSRQMFSLTSTNLKVDISPFVNEALKGFGSAAWVNSRAGVDRLTLACVDQTCVDHTCVSSTHVLINQLTTHDQFIGSVPQSLASWQQWDEAVIEGDEDADLDRKLQVKEQVMELASKLLTGSYARKQAAAGRKCGIEVGFEPIGPV